jgi:hypothetical protein
MTLTFPREIGLKRTVVGSKLLYKKYVNKMRTLTSCYTSLYSFDKMNEEGRPDYRSARIDRAWWDFDAGELGGIEQVKRDVAELINRLEGDVRVVATGRGFHIHQLFDKPVIGQEYRLPLEHYQKRMAKGLVTLDGVGLPEKMTRIPNTYNPKRGRWAVIINGRDFAKTPDTFDIPKRPVLVPDNMHPFKGSVQEGFDFMGWMETYTPNADDYAFIGATKVELDGEMLNAGSVPLMPCLARAVNTQSPNHHVRVALVQHMADTLRDFANPESLSPEQRQQVEDEIFDYIKGLGWKNWNPSLSRKGIRTNMKYRRVPSCAWFVARGMCTGKCWRYDGSTDVIQ